MRPRVSYLGGSIQNAVHLKLNIPGSVKALFKNRPWVNIRKPIYIYVCAAAETTQTFWRADTLWNKDGIQTMWRATHFDKRAVAFKGCGPNNNTSHSVHSNTSSRRRMQDGHGILSKIATALKHTTELTEPTVK